MFIYIYIARWLASIGELRSAPTDPRHKFMFIYIYIIYIYIYIARWLASIDELRSASTGPRHKFIFIYFLKKRQRI
jgi:hypothetical protein